MNKEVITISSIVDLMIQERNISGENAKEYVRVLFSCIEDALIEGEIVKVKGLGVFRTIWQDNELVGNTKETGNGEYQVVFIPENEFKDRVNEPFAHLEPITIKLKDDNKELDNVTEEKLDTFQLFEEQATEIKDLLNEIKALSTVKEEKTSENDDNTNNSSLREKEKEEDLKEKNIPNSEKDIRDTATECNIASEDDSFEIVRIIYKDYPEIIKNKTTYQEKIVETASSISAEEKNIESDVSELQTSSLKVSNKPTVNNEKHKNIAATTEEEEEEEPKSKRIFLYILIGFLVLAIPVALFYLFPYIKKQQRLKIEKEQIERIADSLANEKHFIAIQDSILKQQTDSNNILQDTTENLEKATDRKTENINKVNIKEASITNKTNNSSSVSSSPFTTRKYNKFIGTETMKVGSKLTKFAQNYYGHADFWVYIYEANKDEIKDPNNIPAGAKLKIPELDKQLTDIKNPKAVQYAKELQYKYLNR